MRVALVAVLCAFYVLHIFPATSARVNLMSPTPKYTSNASGLHALQSLKLCDCHFATYGTGYRYPESAGKDALACEEDGFFIAGFQTAGYPRERRDELLPLSPAICCRPCINDQKVNHDQAVAVLTTNCQPAEENSESQCSHQEFIQGFTNAELAKTSDGRAQSYYPYGPAQCCKATMLLKSGKIKPLVPCGCSDSSPGPSVSCGSKGTPEASASDGRLIFGFEHVYDIAQHRTVPTANAKCCHVCVDPSVPAEPAEECEGYNFCNGHGTCSFDRCICSDGYTGIDCLTPPYDLTGPFNGNSKWALSLIVLAGCMMGCCSRLLVCSCERSRRRAPRQIETSDIEEVLLQSGEETSAEEWSTDTEDEDEDVDRDETEERVQEPDGRPTAMPPVAPGGQMQMTPAVSASSSARLRPNASEQVDQGEEEGDEEEEDRCVPAADLPAGEEAEMVDCVEGEDEVAVDEPRVEQAPTPLAECLVCMSERIQVVCVPCGHACMCRKCSRRLRRCPLCRQQVTRRQKLYLSTGP